MPNVAVLVMGPAGAGKVSASYLSLLIFIDNILQRPDGPYRRPEATGFIRQLGPSGGRIHLGTNHRFQPPRSSV
jgi:hypothetical protein